MPPVGSTPDVASSRVTGSSGKVVDGVWSSGSSKERVHELEQAMQSSGSSVKDRAAMFRSKAQPRNPVVKAPRVQTSMRVDVGNKPDRSDAEPTQKQQFLRRGSGSGGGVRRSSSAALTRPRSVTEVVLPSRLCALPRRRRR